MTKLGIKIVHKRISYVEHSMDQDATWARV